MSQITVELTQEEVLNLVRELRSTEMSLVAEGKILEELARNLLAMLPVSTTGK